MTIADYTPSEAPGATDRPTRTEAKSVGYLPPRDAVRFTVRLARPAPPNLRVAIQLGNEEAAGVWARIEELNVTAEGENASEAFSNVVAAARAWLTYLRDEQPALSQDIAPQARYIPLLDAPVFSWFRKFSFADE